MIHILVDSAADFSKKEIEEKGIHLVPLQVSFQEEQYLDCLLYTSIWDIMSVLLMNVWTKIPM